jgi:putative ABC transport system ATP-binding protein
VSNEVRPVAFQVDQLTRRYEMQGETVHALRGVSFEVRAGDYVAIMGPSGSGKSTLLNVLGCLDRPTSGRYLLAGQNVATLDDDALSEVRASSIGFVFQSYNLLQQLNVLENIKVPLQYQGLLGSNADETCRRLAAKVGLGDRLFHRPTELSGGQQQRVAIARSLANDPHFILADEATGNLDSKTTDEVLDLFEELNADGKTIIMITHEDEVASRAKRVIRLRDGLVERTGRWLVVSHRVLVKSANYFGMGRMIRAFSANEAFADLPLMRYSMLSRFTTPGAGSPPKLTLYVADVRVMSGRLPARFRTSWVTSRRDFPAPYSAFTISSLTLSRPALASNLLTSMPLPPIF